MTYEAEARPHERVLFVHEDGRPECTSVQRWYSEDPNGGPEQWALTEHGWVEHATHTFHRDTDPGHDKLCEEIRAFHVRLARV